MHKLAKPMALLGKSMAYDGLEKDRVVISVVDCGRQKTMRNCE